MAITSPDTPEISSRVRLDFLDAIRGLAALYVVINHAAHTFDGEPVNAALWRWTTWMRHGNVSVAIFIVLSGFCLMLPVARARDHQLVGGLRGFAARRARRILPPYYAALILTLLIIAVTNSDPAIWNYNATGIYARTPALTVNVVASHLALIHNLRQSWAYKVNSPFWSVATEWQIYFFFPCLLLPVWRKFGSAATVAAAFLIGLAPHFLMHGRLDIARPWFLGLFALGMAGASLCFSRRDETVSRANRTAWCAAAATTGLILLYADVLRDWGQDHLAPWFVDVWTGVATMAFLVWCTLSIQSQSGGRPAILRALEAKWIVRIGVFSYSLYLIHDCVLVMGSALLRQCRLSTTAEFLLLVVLGVPAALAASYPFHLAFEKRFMSSRKAKR